MRTITESITTRIYKFDELTDEAKKKFTDEQRDFEAEFWTREMFDCLKSAMEEMNINVDDYEIDIHGSSYIVLTADDYDAEDLVGARAYKWIVNNCFNGVDKKKTYWQKNVDIKNCKSRTSNLEARDWMDNCPFSSVSYDYAVKDAWNYWCNALKSGRELSVGDFLDALASHYLTEVSNKYAGFGEDEARSIAEDNGYEFLEDGTIY